MRVAGHCVLAEPGADLGTGVLIDLPVGRLPHRHEEHHVELELRAGLLSADQVPQMWRVEDATEDSRPQGYSRTWPEPSITNL